MREDGSSRGSLEIAHAGSLSGLLNDDLGPRFEELTGWACVGRAGGSRELARQLAEGSASADVFLSADTEVVETELMDEGRANAAAMYVGFATNALVIVYAEGGRHAGEINSRAYPRMIRSTSLTWVLFMLASCRHRNVFAVALAGPSWPPARLVRGLSCRRRCYVGTAGVHV